MPHTVDLTWSDAVNPVGTTYSVWRYTGGGIAFDPTNGRIATSLTTKSFLDTDPTLAVGLYTYYVTATFNGAQGGPSAALIVDIGPIPPTGLTAVVT